MVKTNYILENFWRCKKKDKGSKEIRNGVEKKSLWQISL